MTIKRLSHPVLLVLFLMSCANPKDNENVINSSAISRIDSTLKNFVDSGTIAGVSALIYEKDKEVYYHAYGFADREAKIPMDRNTIIQIYSMTKPITGVALMTLYEKGAFQLDDPLSKYLPEFAELKVCTGVDPSGKLILEPLKRPITIRDITRHTAGFATGNDIPGVGPLFEKADIMNKQNTLAQSIQKLASIPLWFQPGERWAYGPSVDVQAYLVEKISGMRFDRYVRENVLAPLKMKETRYFVPATDTNRLAASYRRSDEGQLMRMPNSKAHEFNIQPWPLTPGGWGLTSTLDDYMRFARMLVHEGTFDGTTILKPEAVRLMATNHLSDSIKERSWLPGKGQVGFGIDFAVRVKPPASVKENNGVEGEFFWDGAASTLFWVDPKNDLTAVLFVQLFPFDRVGLHKKFRDAIYGPLTDK